MSKTLALSLHNAYHAALSAVADAPRSTQAIERQALSSGSQSHGSTIMKNMLIDDAYKVLMLAKGGNAVSVACFNDWVNKNKGMPLFPHADYDAVKNYDDFYSVCYYYIFGD